MHCERLEHEGIGTLFNPIHHGLHALEHPGQWVGLLAN